MKERLLVIDDEAAICSSLSFALEDNYQVEAYTDPKRALRRAREQGFDLCLLDLRIGTTDGLAILPELTSLPDAPAVVMMTAYGSIASSVQAMRQGAFGYLTKPLDMEELETVAGQALEQRRLRGSLGEATRQRRQSPGHAGIVGQSAGMQKIFDLVERLKDVETSVVIHGESGTGKELIARALHYSGRRKHEPFVEVNCAAIPETLIEGELFGYKKGAFTGAIDNHVGKFAYAGRGTLFLDEIGDLPLPLQGKLLRVIQERELTPLGDNRSVKIMARVVAATNRDLLAEVQASRFRKDLYYRLRVMEITVPPLRERMDDVPLLIDHFLQRFNTSFGKAVQGFTEEAKKAVLNWSYPGNVRELANLVERAVLLTDDTRAGLAALPEDILGHDPDCGELTDKQVFRYLAGRSLEEIEAGVIRETLDLNAGHRQNCASQLGISERGLRNKLDRYKLK